MHQFSTLQIFLSEFIGTALLIVLGVGVCANVTLKKSYGFGDKQWLLISFGWGFAVFAGASVAWKSGAQLNPAVTLGLAISGSLKWSLVPLYMFAEVTGAMAGAVLAYLAYKKQFDTHDDPANTGGIFYTHASVRSNVWNIVTEVIGTFVLVYWVLESSPFEPGTEDSAPQFGNSALGYAAVAFVVIAIGACLGGPTGYAINPARDLGPRIIYSILPIKGRGSSNWGYAWIAILGPLIGGALAALLFNAIGG